jgi:hypothetical protein
LTGKDSSPGSSPTAVATTSTHSLRTRRTGTTPIAVLQTVSLGPATRPVPGTPSRWIRPSAATTGGSLPQRPTPNAGRAKAAPRQQAPGGHEEVRDPLERRRFSRDRTPKPPPSATNLINDATSELAPAAPAESRVTVKIHPSLLGTELPWTALSLQGGPDGPTCSGTTSSRPETPRQTRKLSPGPVPETAPPSSRRSRLVSTRASYQESAPGRAFP